MHRPVILFATLAIIGGSANAAQEESGAAPPCDGCDQGHRRQRGLGATNVEYVSEEPLTFETPEPEPVDRESLLANEIVEVEDEDEGDGEVMDDMHLTLAIIGANAQEEREAAEGEEDESRRLSDVIEPLTFPLESSEYFDNEYDLMDGEEDEAYGAEWFPNDESDGAEEWGEFEPSYEDGDFDSTYASEDGSDFHMDDYDEMIEDESGLPKKAFNAPIARRLRRLDDPVEAVEDMADEMDEAEIDWDRYLAEKESLREEYASVPIFEPTQDENEEFDLSPYAEPDFQEELALDFEELEGDDHGRHLQGCSGNRKRVKVVIKTDQQGFESSWNIKKGNGVMLTKGPPNGRRYGDNRQYIGSMCLGPGNYVVTFNDKFKDGMCGQRTGRGWYKVYVNGVARASSPSNCALNWAQRRHSISIRASGGNQSRPQSRPNPAPRPNASRPSGNNNAIATSSRGGCTNVQVQVKVDKFGRETTMKLMRGGATVMSSVKNIGAYQTKTIQKCLPPGTYILKMIDKDGICCGNGKGFYKMIVSGATVLSGAYFVGSKTHTIKIGSNWQAQMTSRDREWLNAHNSRRRQHNGGKGYVPLRYSKSLASDARSYANRLANNCNSLKHASGLVDGENLARNKGSGSYGKMPPANNVMNRWVDKELNWPYPKNAHMTQVVWRASQYVGCGESMRQVGGGQICRTQVCRYARAGNCNVRNKNWRSEAWKDSTGCGRECPGGGCFA